MVPWVGALVPIALACAAGLGVGDPQASGIVEESLGGPGPAVVLVAVLAGLPTLVVGLVVGLSGGLRSTGLRTTLRLVAAVGAGCWCGVWVWAVAELSCDGSCVVTDRGAVWSATATTLAAVVLAAVLSAWTSGWSARRRDVGPVPPGGA